MAWDFSTDPEFDDELAWTRGFVRDEIYPLEVLDLDHAGFRRIATPLQDEVKARGLWAAHLDPELGGQGLRAGQARHCCTRSSVPSCWRPYVFGCQAPDSGNAEMIALAGTDEQKRTWLDPLLDGRVLRRSR